MSLDETYDRILQGITRERQEYAQRLLHCLAESIRPLRAEELAEILAIQFDTGTIPNYDVNWRPENPEEAVLSACSSLITIVDMDTSRVVQFSHFSVKEYLTSERLANAGKQLSQYHILPDSAHTILAQASLSVLLALDDQIDKERMKNFPFAIYAARYWVDHAQFANVCSSIKVAMERLFDPVQPHFSAWVWIYDLDYKFREIMFGVRPTPPKAIPLYYATLCGFRDLVEHLIVTYPLDVNARGGFYLTPLHAAVTKGNVDVVVLLLEHGADVAMNRQGLTPLYEASRIGNLDVMSLLLDRHADVNTHDENGYTPLYLASLKGQLEVAQVLLRHGAAVDIVAIDGWTPLISASRNGHADIVRLLLQNGASVDSRDNNGWTPLLSASRYGHPDVVRFLLQNGASVDSRNNDGCTSLMLASGDDHLDVIHLLLRYGASVDSRDNNGWTPLSSASQYEHPDVVRLLLQNGANVDSCNNEGWTPLTFASGRGRLDIVHLLLQNGANVDSRDNYGWTPIMSASRYGHPDIVRSLLRNGANVDSRDNSGWTPLLSASQYEHPDVARLLLQNGASVKSRNDYGRTALAIASQNGHLDIVRLLLQSGADVDYSPDGGWFPSSGVSRFPSQFCAAVSSSPRRFKSRGPRLLYSSSSRIR
jgi:ankyrin repeat protein